MPELDVGGSAGFAGAAVAVVVAVAGVVVARVGVGVGVGVAVVGAVVGAKTKLAGAVPNFTFEFGAATGAAVVLVVVPVLEAGAGTKRSAGGWFDCCSAADTAGVMVAAVVTARLR